MPLPLPNLDDRRWADLVDEGRALIPRYARQWTDHNVSDPGVTLLELFAWMTESSVYSLNRVTPQHRQKFLSLLGFAPEPPRPARTMLGLGPAAGAASFVLPAGTEFEARNSAGSAVPFRTLRALTVSDVRLTAVQVDDGSGLTDATVEWRNGLPIRPLGSSPKMASALYLGFEAIPVSQPVALAFQWERPGGDASARAVQSAEERSRLIAEHRARLRACRNPVPEIACPGAAPLPEPSSATPPHHSARIVWEAFTGTWTPLEPVTPPASPNVGQVADDTRSLTLDGLVEVNLPAGTVKSTLGAVAKPLFYVRCRLQSGEYDAPPGLLDVTPNAVPAEQAVPLSQRFAIPPAVVPTGTSGGTVPKPGSPTRFRLVCDAAGTVQSLAFDPTAAGLPDVMVLDYDKAVAVAGHLTVDMVRVGNGTGLPDQEVVLPGRVIASDDTLAVFSHDGIAWQRWQLRSDFHASARADWHCTLDRTTAILAFGNGDRGRVAPPGHSLFVVGRTTTAAAGAISARAALKVRKSATNELLLKSFPVPLNVLGAMTTLAWPAAGATDQETLAHGSGRAAEALHAHERLVDLAREVGSDTLDQINRESVRGLRTPSKAVSLLDIERMALDVPGTRVARARAWPGVQARYPCLSAPGSITLVIVPGMPAAQRQPSAGLLRAVKRYLHRRRMVTTMLDVVGPRYLPVKVKARVRLRRGSGLGRVEQALHAALNRFLDPLEGGPEGLGWPFGRSVYRAEILQLMDAISGVDNVLELSLSAAGGSPQCGNLTLCPTWLVTPGVHEIRGE
jgi:hypothetical protein